MTTPHPELKPLEGVYIVVSPEGDMLTDTIAKHSSVAIFEFLANSGMNTDDFAGSGYRCVQVNVKFEEK